MDLNLEPGATPGPWRVSNFPVIADNYSDIVDASVMEIRAEYESLVDLNEPLNEPHERYMSSGLAFSSV